MGDEGEKTCPLCTEEMDLTDQQLKPCKCGYEICVWCWHQIMDMAEKDNTEGRCPACRTCYDKEKIVGMSVDCERLVAGINSERRQKSQKAKSKTSEGRKHLSNVRVIQRNLVYIIGIPVTLADEDTLKRKEFFGQYGKVLKVSVSWPASGGQHLSNNSACNVYITYSKEEEAVRCIQSVHGFILEGRPLRACYGTTKYCHTWLRNMPCNNPDCLYLHELGTQEDSFTKDEIISAYTRVLQIVAASNNSQRYSGNILPPPVDDYCINAASTDNMDKNFPNNPAHQSKGSPSNEHSGRSSVLPAAAAWCASEDLTREPSGESGLYDGARHNLHSILYSENGDGVIQVDNSDLGQQKRSASGQLFSQSPGNAAERSHQYSPEHGIGAVEHLTLLAASESERTCASKDLFDCGTKFQTHESPSKDSENVEVLLPVDQVLKNAEPSPFLPSSCSPSENSYHSSDHLGPSFTNGLSIPSSRAEDAKEDDLFRAFSNGCTALSNGCTENECNISTTESVQFCESNVEKLRYLGESNGYTSIDDEIASLNLGESTIISNILSVDFDPWDGSLTHSFTELLKETALQNGYYGLSNSHKPQYSSQSRFAFARQDDFMDQATCLQPSSNDMEHLQKSSAVLDSLQNRESPGHRRLNGYMGINFEDFQNPFSSHSSLVSNQASVSRSQISVPPGFAVVNRVFPPGFSFEQRMDHGNQLVASASMPTNQHQLPPPAGNIGDAGDVEFMDPAILAVSRERFPLGGMSDTSWTSASVFQAQQTIPKNDARIQLLMQPAKSFHQNLQYSDCAADMFAHLNDAHIQTQLAGRLIFNGNGPSPCYLEQLSSFQQSRNIGMSNSPWDSCNTIQSGANLAMAEILRNDIPDLDKYNSGYDELRFHRSTAMGDLYSRAFGM